MVSLTLSEDPDEMPQMWNLIRLDTVCLGYHYFQELKFQILLNQIGLKIPVVNIIHFKTYTTRTKGLMLQY